MSTILHVCFQSIVCYVCHATRQDSSFDGKAFWRKMKPILAVLDDRVGRNGWILNQKEKKIILDVIGFKNNHPGLNKMSPISWYFLGQHVWLTEEPQNVRKILQIAFNIGQFLGTSDYDMMSIVDYWNHHLYDISTYVSTMDECGLSLHITNQMFDQIMDMV